jgi:hypothetical protein
VSQPPHGWSSPHSCGELALREGSRATLHSAVGDGQSSSFGVRGAHEYEGYFRVHLRVFHVKRLGMCTLGRDSGVCGSQVDTDSTRSLRFM